MPFKSKSQRRACWAQYRRDKKAGKEPQWDCKKWEKETTGKLPEKANMLGGKISSPQTVLDIKQDLESFSKEELQLLAKHQKISDNIDQNDKYWIIAINNFLDQN